jgi:hypothetical protein
MGDRFEHQPMEYSRRSRKVVHLSEELHQRLNVYSLAATAAGVSALALAQPAQAKIIYTPASTQISCYSKVNLDFNHDGNPDFVLFNADVYTYRGGYCRLSVLPTTQGNQIWGAGKSASALPAGVRVGPKGKLGAHYFMAKSPCCSSSGGPWANAQDRYLGLKFTIRGRTHFGWARLSVTVSPVAGTLTGYAFETIPNKPIYTGKRKGLLNQHQSKGRMSTAAPSVDLPSLGRLAQGASTSRAWQRDNMP